MTLHHVPAKNLHAGDLCTSSRQRVIRVTHHGLTIPGGNVEVELERDNGSRRVALWNRRTSITVERDNAS